MKHMWLILFLSLIQTATAQSVMEQWVSRDSAYAVADGWKLETKSNGLISSKSRLGVTHYLFTSPGIYYFVIYIDQCNGCPILITTSTEEGNDTFEADAGWLEGVSRAIYEYEPEKSIMGDLTANVDEEKNYKAIVLLFSKQ